MPLLLYHHSRHHSPGPATTLRRAPQRGARCRLKPPQVAAAAEWTRDSGLRIARGGAAAAEARRGGGGAAAAHLRSRLVLVVAPAQPLLLAVTLRCRVRLLRRRRRRGGTGRAVTGPAAQDARSLDLAWRERDVSQDRAARRGTNVSLTDACRRSRRCWWARRARVGPRCTSRSRWRRTRSSPTASCRCRRRHPSRRCSSSPPRSSRWTGAYRLWGCDEGRG